MSGRRHSGAASSGNAVVWSWPSRLWTRMAGSLTRASDATRFDVERPLIARGQDQCWGDQHLRYDNRKYCHRPFGARCALLLTV